MAIFYYLVRGKTFTRRDDFANVPTEVDDAAWAHSVAPSAEELDGVLDELRASPEVREATHDPSPHPEFFVDGGAAWLSFPIQGPEEWSREYLTVLLRGRRLFTMTRRPVGYIEAFRERAEKRGVEDAAHPLAGLFDAVTRADRDALESIRDAVDALEERLDAGPTGVSIHDIRRLKNAVLKCGNICEDQAFCLGSMATPAAEEVVGVTKTSIRGTMLAVIRHIDRSFDRLDVRARELEQHLQMAYQKRAEDRLRVLTVISAVFSPLTVVAGIYGMNFAVIPELSVPHAYYIALGTMAGLAAAMMAYFYRQGWLSPSR